MKCPYPLSMQSRKKYGPHFAQLIIFLSILRGDRYAITLFIFNRLGIFLFTVGLRGCASSKIDVSVFQRSRGPEGLLPHFGSGMVKLPCVYQSTYRRKLVFSRYR